MKVLICTVQGDPASRRDNARRIESLEKLLKRSTDLNVDLIIMPGGFLRTLSTARIEDDFPSLRAAVEGQGISICFGVDTARKPSNPTENAVSRYELPAFGFAWTPVDGWQGPWRQRSTSGKNQLNMSARLAAENRILQVAGERVAILVCGELFNRAIQGHVDRSGVVAVADMVHTGKDFRFHSAAPRWCLSAPIRAVLMSCHVWRRDAAKRWAMDGKYFSKRKADIIVTSPIRIESVTVSV